MTDMKQLRWIRMISEVFAVVWSSNLLPASLEDQIKQVLPLAKELIDYLLQIVNDEDEF